MRDARLLHRERCPACARLGRDRHGDNLAVYDDGHSHCYSCGYRVTTVIPNSYLAKRLYQHKPASSSADALSDLGELTYALPPAVSAWLDKYGITELERLKNGMQWSEEKQYLILPIFNEQGYCIGTNSRYFGSNPNHPKYMTKLTQPGYFKLVTPDVQKLPLLVCVEDIVSSIKVGRHVSSIALLGTHIPDDLLLRIVGHCKSHSLSCIIWLDPDKRDDSLRWAKRFSQFLPAMPLWSDHDPKEHTDAELVELLSGAVQVLAGGSEQLDQVPADSQQELPQGQSS